MRQHGKSTLILEVEPNNVVDKRNFARNVRNFAKYLSWDEEACGVIIDISSPGASLGEYQKGGLVRWA